MHSTSFVPIGGQTKPASAEPCWPAVYHLSGSAIIESRFKPDPSRPVPLPGDNLSTLVDDDVDEAEVQLLWSIIRSGLLRGLPAEQRAILEQVRSALESYEGRLKSQARLGKWAAFLTGSGIPTKWPEVVGL